MAYNKLKKMSPAEIGKLSASQTSDLLRKSREIFKQREKSFAKAGRNIFSYALDKMQSYYEDKGVQSTEKMSRNEMQAELFRLQEFFNSQTANVKGARLIMREQDARIFGIDENGNPIKRMTLEERTKFWSVYEEFMKSNPRYDNVYQSGKVQQYLGEIMTGERKEKGVFKKDSIGLIKRLSELQRKMREDESDYEYFGFNVFSGRGITE